jgi:cation diffusion facilitator CzcD-associated flavoprotein CzcO
LDTERAINFAVPMTQTARVATGNRPTVAIVGGGYSGAVLAWHLHRTAPYQHNIIFIEPRPEIGRGLAYDSRDPAHRINVPALKMNLAAAITHRSSVLAASPVVRHKSLALLAPHRRSLRRVSRKREFFNG